MKTEICLILDEPALKSLLLGGEVTIKDGGLIIKMILRDIGFDRIEKILADAMAGIDHYKSVTTDGYGNEIKEK